MREAVARAFAVVSENRVKGSPSIPARPRTLKNTGNFKDDKNFVPGLKPCHYPRNGVLAMAFLRCIAGNSGTASGALIPVPRALAEATLCVAVGQLRGGVLHAPVSHQRSKRGHLQGCAPEIPENSPSGLSRKHTHGTN